MLVAAWIGVVDCATGSQGEQVGSQSRSAPLRLTRRVTVDEAIALLRPAGSAELFAEKELRDIPLTLELGTSPASGRVLDSLARLLQAKWTRPEPNGSRRVLQRSEGTLALIKARTKQLMALEARVRKEQADRLPGALKQLRGVVADGEQDRDSSRQVFAMVESLTASEWGQVFANTRFVRPTRGDVFLQSLTPQPGIAFELCDLTGPRAQLFGSYVDRLFGRDRSAVSHGGVGVVSINGEVIGMIGSTGLAWGSPLAVVKLPAGPALEEYKRLHAAAYFDPDGPRFAPELPDSLTRRKPFQVGDDWKSLSLPDVVDRLGRHLGLTVLSDNYSLLPSARLTIPPGPIPPAALFAAINRRFGCWFAVDEGVLLLRRPDWPEMEPREPPPWVISRCLEQKRRDYFSTIEPDWLASLSTRLTRLQFHALLCQRDPEDESLNLQREGEAGLRHYEVLRFIEALGPTFRRRLLSVGLDRRQLNAAPGSALYDWFAQRFPGLVRGNEQLLGIRAFPGTQRVGRDRRYLDLRIVTSRREMLLGTSILWPLDPRKMVRLPPPPAPRHRSGEQAGTHHRTADLLARPDRPSVAPVCCVGRSRGGSESG